jgi:hypothetical protein
VVSLQPVSIITGNPVSASTDLSPLSDNTTVFDWHSYFYAVKPPFTQGHNLASSDIEASAPTLQATALSENYNILVEAILSGQPVISSTGLIEVKNFQANDLLTGRPLISPAPITEDENFFPANLLTEAPAIGTSSLTQSQNLGSDDITTPFPELGRPVDPNAIVAQEIKEIEQMFGGWQRRTYEVPDGKLVQAEREIQATFGDVVSIDKKAKSLIKFGKSAPLPINSLQTIWTVGGDEVYVSDNTIAYISSSSALDTQEVTIEGHTVSGTGFDQQFTFVTQNIILNGQTPVALATPLARTSRIYNNNGQELVGRIVVYENTSVVGGIPSDQTKIHIDIPTGFQSSFKAATTFSNEDYYILTGAYGAVSLKQTAAVDFYLEVKLAGKTFRQVALFTASSSGGAFNVEFDPSIIIPKNADVRLRCESSSNNAVAFGVFKGYLAKVTG